MRRVCQRLDGAFTLVAVDDGTPDTVVGARRNSPLVVGRGEGQDILSSDVAGFIAHTREAMEVGQNPVVEVRAGGVGVPFFDNAPAEGTLPRGLGCRRRREGRPPLLHAQGDRGAAARRRQHAARPDRRGGADRMDEMRMSKAEMRNVDKVFVVACGTASRRHDRQVRHRAVVPDAGARSSSPTSSATATRCSRDTLVIAISQSGETTDTLMAVSSPGSRAPRCSICNTQGATIPRESDAVIYTHAGPEVASRQPRRSSPRDRLFLLGLHLATSAAR